ncbi:ankyrin repeat domain-containing protein 22 isoform X2 [Austrofundulus limnaeus]|uniref:Ankyrin repeat domain-containing protein 22 isoform X2 n=1 Tax=Austrofundulus limnaeus TaxID=52670 RepID=A0A2I4CFK4_AUSLI|nr:PREDICTED: ankyrin repeat domain-containing protein 22 isoform X2 [Austrofundulus limnaeus]
MGLVYSEPSCQAAYNGDVHRLYTVLCKDATQLNVQEEYTGDTPLIAACRRGNLNVVKYLLQNKANVQLTNKKKRTCLHYVSKRTFTVLDYLMIAILMPVMLLGYFVMLQKQRKSVELMNAVLNSGVDISAVDYKGNTALHYVCQKKSSRLVPLLLQFNAKTDIRNKEGETPLDIATRQKFTKIINMLRKTH